MSASTPQAAHLQLGETKRKKARGVYKASAEAVEDARRKFEATRAAVKVVFTGADFAALGGAGHSLPFVYALDQIERALAAYVANTHLGVGKKPLALALKTRPFRLREMLHFVEAWRASPVCDDALLRVERALPRSM